MDFTLSLLVPHIRPAVRTKNGHWAVASVIIDATVSLSSSGEREASSPCFSCTLLNPSPTLLLARLQAPCLLGFQTHMSAVWGNG